LKIDVLIIRSKTVALFAVVLFMLACRSDSTGGGISGGDTDSPVQAELVHGTLFVVSALVNDSIDLDMLVDTGASGTYVPAEIFGNDGGEVHISSLCLENDICFKNFKAQSSDSAFTQSTPGYFNGIIGINLLENFDITFDYKSKLIYFYDAIENASASVVSIPFSYQSGRPFTNVSIEGQSQGNNLLDTGAAFTRITSAMLDSLIQEPDVLFESIVFNLNGSEIVEYLPLTDYCLGIACPGEIIAQKEFRQAGAPDERVDYLTMGDPSRVLLAGLVEKVLEKGHALSRKGLIRDKALEQVIHQVHSPFF
jgi:predicted aspartyl protease